MLIFWCFAVYQKCEKSEYINYILLPIFRCLQIFTQHCSVQCNSVCTENYWIFSSWISMYRSRRITYFVLVRLWRIVSV